MDVCCWFIAARARSKGKEGRRERGGGRKEEREERMKGGRKMNPKYGKPPSHQDHTPKKKLSHSSESKLYSSVSRLREIYIS